MIKNILISYLLIFSLSISSLSANNFWNENKKVFNELSKMMDKKFDNFNNQIINLKSDFKKNFLETKDAYIFEFDLPGLNKSNVEVYIQDKELFIKGKKEKNHQSLKIRNYSYIVTLPKNINKKKINAIMKDGVLKVILMKIENQNLPKQIIEIQQRDN